MSNTRSRRDESTLNDQTRVDQLTELAGDALPAVRAFFRRIDLPHAVDEVVVPLLEEGDSQVFLGVRDRPWPPWGLGSRHVLAFCQTYPAGEGTYGVTPVFAGEEDTTNVGLISVVYKEAIESLAMRHAEVSYLAAEHSVLADLVLRRIGFEKTQDVLLTETARYFTYRAEADELLTSLRLDSYGPPEILAHEVDPDMMAQWALFHQTVYLSSRPEWSSVSAATCPEMVRLVRFGHFSKPGGTDQPSRFRPPDDDWSFIQLIELVDFLEPEMARSAQEELVSRQGDFQPATVEAPGDSAAREDADVRKGQVLGDLGGLDDAVRSRLLEQLPDLFAELGMEPFEVSEIEIQATASSDGDYFRVHTDTDESSSRALSFTLFLTSDPQQYSGGELRIFRSDLTTGDPADASVNVTPKHNHLVIFPSDTKHEILPVNVPSKQFAHGRFTINGWIHRAD